jgi:reactive chlorine resistance protein C
MTTQRRGVTPVRREEALANAVPPDLFPDSVEAPAAAHARFDPAALAPALDVAGGAVLRYGLVAILVLFGAFKFTAVEAAGIEPLVRHSPLLSWLYALTSVRGASDVIGVIELLVAALIAARRFSPRAAAAGSMGAVAVFVATLTFLVSTPGIWVMVPGFPLAVPNATGAFLVKDVFLLGAALWSAGEALRAIHRPKATATPA